MRDTGRGIEVGGNGGGCTGLEGTRFSVCSPWCLQILGGGVQVNTLVS